MQKYKVPSVDLRLSSSDETVIVFQTCSRDARVRLQRRYGTSPDMTPRRPGMQQCSAAQCVRDVSARLWHLQYSLRPIFANARQCQDLTRALTVLFGTQLSPWAPTLQESRIRDRSARVLPRVCRCKFQCRKCFPFPIQFKSNVPESVT